MGSGQIEVICSIFFDMIAKQYVCRKCNSENIVKNGTMPAAVNNTTAMSAVHMVFWNQVAVTLELELDEMW